MEGAGELALSPSVPCPSLLSLGLSPRPWNEACPSAVGSPLTWSGQTACALGPTWGSRKQQT